MGGSFLLVNLWLLCAGRGAAGYCLALCAVLCCVALGRDGACPGHRTRKHALERVT